jgi:hypothetical protein
MIRLSVGASRKVPGTENYSSDGFHAELQVELPDAVLGDVEQVRSKLNGLFREARRAVDLQVNGNGGKPDPNAGLRSRIGAALGQQPQPQAGTTNNNGDAATHKQIGFIRSLAKRQGINRDQLDALVREICTGRTLADGLDRREASQVIEVLQHEP